MTGGRRLPRRRRNRILAWLTGASSLLLGLLAVATNLATGAIPTSLKGLAADPRWTWGAAGGLLAVCVTLAVLERRVSGADDVDRLPTNLPVRNASFVGRR